MSLELILIIPYLAVLIKLSLDDYNTMYMKLEEVLVLCLIGLLYGIAAGDYIKSISYLLVMIMIFGLPCLFSLGLGDFLIFLSLAPFLAPGDIFDYLFLFLGIWLLYHVYMINKKVISGELKNFRESFSRKNINTLFYPLVPVIFISFILWLFLQYILPF